MHAIERYGLVALLFLVVTVVAVLMWDGEKKPKGVKPAPTAQAAAPETKARASEPQEKLALVVKEEPGPLQRRPAPGREGLHPGGDGALPADALAGADEPANQPESAPLVDPAGGANAAARNPTQPVSLPAPERPIANANAAPANAPATHAYRVQSGDTLSEIAQRELGSSRRWNEIVAANPGLDPARLRAGKTIQIPGAGSARAASAPAREANLAGAAKTPAAKGGTYTVGKGDNLWKIAERALGDGARWKEIAALNPKVNPDRLAAGQVLELPVRGGAAPKAGTKSGKSAAPLVASANDARSTSPRRASKVK